MTTGRICKKLRTKSMFVSPAGEALDQTNQETARSSHCWCNGTLTETGPDDRPVGIDACNPSRPCFEE